MGRPAREMNVNLYKWQTFTLRLISKKRHEDCSEYNYSGVTTVDSRIETEENVCVSGITGFGGDAVRLL